MSTPFRHVYDVVVVGARIAGASTAMLLARQGARVLLVDHAKEGSDTLSTHALMRGGVLQLARWGLLDRVMASGARPVRQATFRYGDAALTVPIEPRHGVDALVAPRRTVLDPILVDAARRAGAQVSFETKLVGLRWTGGRVSGVRIADRDRRPVDVKASVVIGADGIRSPVGLGVGAPFAWQGTHATACVYGHFEGLPDEGYEWYFEEGAAAGVIPTNGGLSCVFACLPRERLASKGTAELGGIFDAVVAEAAPSLMPNLRRARRGGPLRAFTGHPGFLRRCVGPGWALVGDASHFKDPLTAHGMTDALRDAELLTRAVMDGRVDAYRERRDDLSIRFLQIADAIASFDWTLRELAAMHVEMNREMGREVAALLTLDARDVAAA